MPERGLREKIFIIVARRKEQAKNIVTACRSYFPELICKRKYSFPKYTEVEKKHLQYVAQTFV